MPCAENICFRDRRGLAEKLEILIRNTCNVLGFIIPGATRSIMKSWPSHLGSTWNSTVADDLTARHMRVYSKPTVCDAIRMVATGVSFQSCFYIRSCTTVDLLCYNIGTSEEYHDITLLLLEKFLQIYLSIIEVSSKLYAAKLSTIPNHTRTLKLPMCMKTGWFHRARRFFFGGIEQAWQLLLFNVCKPFFPQKDLADYVESYVVRAIENWRQVWRRLYKLT